MKKDHENRRHPIRVTAETLRHLGRSELAAVGGGATTTITQAIGGNITGITNADGVPTLTTGTGPPA